MEASDQYSAAAPTGVPVATNAAPQAGSAVPDGEIQLTMFDKMRRMVSTDEEWDAILLQKMELKRNRGTLVQSFIIIGIIYAQSCYVKCHLTDRLTVC